MPAAVISISGANEAVPEFRPVSGIDGEADAVHSRNFAVLSVQVNTFCFGIVRFFVNIDSDETFACHN
jgi:hypothetical protein